MTISRQQRRYAARQHATAPVADFRILNLRDARAGKAFIDGGVWTFVATPNFVLAVRDMEVPEGVVLLRADISFKVAADLGAGDDMEAVFDGDAGDLREFGAELQDIERAAGREGHGAALLGGAAFPWAVFASSLLPLLPDAERVRMGLVMGPDGKVRMIAATAGFRYLQATAPSAGGAPALKLPTPRELAERGPVGDATSTEADLEARCEPDSDGPVTVTVHEFTTIGDA